MIGDGVLVVAILSLSLTAMVVSAIAFGRSVRVRARTDRATITLETGDKETNTDVS